MVVKDFLPVTDVKITTEKQVQQKPTIQELTTIESPGRPSPASMLESPEEKKKARKPRKKDTAQESNVKVQEPKRDSVLIITEKPQAAEKIANALGKPRMYKEEGVSYFEVEKDGKKIIVASAVGHLFNLTYSKGQKGWPIFDLEWIPSYEGKKGAFTRRYYNTLKKLSRSAKEYIVATDFDIEGEVIGWNVLRFICKQKTAKRMKYSTLTGPELLKSYENPMPELEWGQAYAGETRHILDWLYGINLSRALMSAIKTSGSFKILSIGRVQGPALKIIVDREREIESFKPEPYWQAFAEIDWKAAGLLEPAGGCRFMHPQDIFDKKELEKFKNIKEADAETQEKDENMEPPHPFDLTTLQREMYRLHKASPSETLKIAQKLYLDGLISYPRTSSQKIPKEIEPKKILKTLSENFKEAKLAKRDNPVEGKKSDPAHPSIYPTGEFKQLSDREEGLYNLVVKRFISAFSPDAKLSNKKITLLSIPDKIKFTANATQVKEKGWLSIYPMKIEESSLPNLNGKVKIDEIKIEEKETQPPNRYTPTSLVSILEKKNLGTKATRSAIVDTLFDRGYLDGKSIQATQLGLRLITALEKYSPIIIDENLTRQLEEEMEKILESKSNFEAQEHEIIKKARKLIEDISKEFKVQEKNIGQELLKGLENFRKEQQEASTLMPCSTCKKGNLRIMYSKKTRRYFVGCSSYPECTQTYSLPPNALIKKTDNNKLCEADHFPKLLAIKKARRPWEFCFNPECPIEKAKRQEWEEKKAAKMNRNSS